jgi:hypothetical protein
MHQLQACFLHLSVAKKVYKFSFSNRSMLETFNINRGPMIALHGPAHMLPALLSWRVCRYTCGFRELHSLRIWDLTERLSSAKLFHLEIASLTLTISPTMCVGRKLQKPILSPILLFCSYTGQLIRRIRNTASVSTTFFRFHSYLSSYINITQWPTPQCTNQHFH